MNDLNAIDLEQAVKIIAGSDLWVLRLKINNPKDLKIKKTLIMLRESKNFPTIKKIVQQNLMSF